MSIDMCSTSPGLYIYIHIIYASFTTVCGSMAWFLMGSENHTSWVYAYTLLWLIIYIYIVHLLDEDYISNIYIVIYIYKLDTYPWTILVNWLQFKHTIIFHRLSNSKCQGSNPQHPAATKDLCRSAARRAADTCKGQKELNKGQWLCTSMDLDITNRIQTGYLFVNYNCVIVYYT